MAQQEVNIRKEYESSFEIAKKYYGILFMLNDIKLTEKDLNLIAFTADRGYITTSKAQNDFIRTFKTTKNYLYTLVSKLQRMGVLIKEKGTIRLHPKIRKDFNNDFLLTLKIVHETKSKEERKEA